MDQTDNNLWSIESNRYYPVTNINTINTIPSGIYTFCRDYSKNANYLITRLRQMLESKKENSQNYDKKEIGFTTKGNLNNLSGIFKTNGQ